MGRPPSLLLSFMLDSIRSQMPRQCVPNSAFATLWKDWTAQKIFEKTGIKSRYIASEDECASDLAVAAAEKLLSGRDRSRIGFLLHCTESPDYTLPPTACLLQERLGLSTSCGAFDINLACSAYVYALATAHAYLETGIADEVLLLTADTYSKYIHPEDRSTRTIFGDAGTATLLTKASPHRFHSFVLHTDGRGAESLILKTGGCRNPRLRALDYSLDADGKCSPDFLYMNGPDVFDFTLRAVPSLVTEVCTKAQCTLDAVDHVVFHQANLFMLEHLRKKLKIPEEKFVYHIENWGNTVSSTIPLALEACIEEGRFNPGDKILLAGFGVGLSWAGCMLDWH